MKITNKTVISFSESDLRELIHKSVLASDHHVNIESIKIVYDDGRLRAYVNIINHEQKAEQTAVRMKMSQVSVGKMS